MPADKTVDPIAAAKRLKAKFRDSEAFEACLAEMRANRAYTKPVFMDIFKALFPKRPLPPATIKRADLIARIARQRRRDENIAAA